MRSLFTLRMFKPTDLERVMHINRVCLPENYTAFFFMDLYKRFPATFIVAEKNEEVVGYVMCRIETGLSLHRIIGIARKAHIISFAVMPKRQRQGIGCALIREAMKKMPLYKTKECYLEVRVSNAPAVNLYKKVGFRILRRRNGYYIDGEDAYVMGSKLPMPSARAKEG